MARWNNLSFVDYRSQFYNDTADHTLVDVRTRSEYAGGHLPQALNIPLNELQNRIDEVPRNKPVVVVCASGNRSQTGSDVLVAAGYGNVYNLEGGTMVWMMNGMPLEH